MSTDYLVLTKSQKALQDIVNLADATVKSEQVTFNSLPSSPEKDDFLVLCAKFQGAINSGTCDKLTVKAMAQTVKSKYESLIKGDTRKASSKYEKEVATLKASLLLGVPADELIKKQDDRENTALYRKNLLTTDKGLQEIINNQ
jgi:hypothetical protein